MQKYLVTLEWCDFKSVNISTIEEYHKFEDYVHNKVVYPFECYYGNNYYCFDSPHDVFNSIEIQTISEEDERVFKRLVGTWGLGLDLVENVLEQFWEEHEEAK